MIGIGSLLTDEAYLEVQTAQQRLKKEHGIPGESIIGPHITHVVRNGVGALEELVERLVKLASETDPLAVCAAGLGLFPGPAPVLYLPVPRNPALAAVHRAVCELLTDGDGAIAPCYHPEMWLPHVTLVSRGITPDMVAAVTTDLLPGGLAVTSQLLGFILAEETAEDRWEITREFPFRGQNALPPNPFGLTCRPCQPSDQEFVYRLLVDSLKPLVSVYHPWSEARFEQNFASSWRQKVVVLAKGQRVGYLQYDGSAGDHLYVGGLFLAASARGRGWGKWLLGYMEGMAGGQPVRLHVWENNPAVEFYQRQGYRIVRTEEHKHLMEKG